MECHRGTVPASGLVVHIDDLPAEILHHVLSGADQHGRALLDPHWRFAAAAVCRLWRLVVRNPPPSRSCAMAAITEGRRRSLDSALKKEDAFLVRCSFRYEGRPEKKPAAPKHNTGRPDRRALKCAAAQGRFISAAYMVENIRRGSLALGAGATFDPVPWSGVRIPAADAALCRLLALDDTLSPATATAGLDAVLDLLAHRVRSRAACTLLGRLIRYGRTMLIGALIDHVPGALSPWWHIRLACKYDCPAGLASILIHMLVNNKKPRKWTAMAWRKIALYDSITTFKVMLDDAHPPWVTPSWEGGPWDSLRALCAELWIADDSWQRKAARNGSWRALDACAVRGWSLCIDQVIREAALCAWWRTVVWAIEHASSKAATAAPGENADPQGGGTDIDALCRETLRTMMGATHAWPRNAKTEAWRNTVNVLCAHIEQRSDRDRWPAVAAALWRDAPRGVGDDPIPWSLPFVFARWRSVLPVTPDETHSIVRAAIASNDYAILDTVVAAIASSAHHVAWTTRNSHWARHNNGDDDDESEMIANRSVSREDEQTVDLWRDTVDRYVRATHTMQRYRRRYNNTHHHDMDTLLASWDQSGAAEMLMFLASVTEAPSGRGGNGGRRGLWSSTSVDNGNTNVVDTAPNNERLSGPDADDGAYMDPDGRDDVGDYGACDRVPGSHATIKQWRCVCRVVPLASHLVGWAPASGIASYLGPWLAERGLLFDTPTDP
nr:F-box domain protein [Pandoravirus massiliensis]